MKSSKSSLTKKDNKSENKGDLNKNYLKPKKQIKSEIKIKQLDFDFKKFYVFH